MPELLETGLRSAFAYILLMLLGRLVGRKMLSQITLFDFLLGVTLGSLATHVSIGNNSGFWSSTLAAVVITLLTLLTEFVSIKSIRFRKLEGGEPLVLISGGQIQDCNLKRARMSVEKLTMLLRQRNFFDLGDVNFAVLESDGQLSVLPKPSMQPATAGDLNREGKSTALAYDLIIDGKLLYPQLKQRNLDKQWVLDQLALQDVHEIGSVFYAGIEPSGNIYVSQKTPGK